MTDWQPISTAPKDGTDILLICMKAHPDCKSRERRMHVDRWSDGSKHGYVGWGSFNERYFPATHWQPLPAPPNPEAS